jgi:hypothetical protein
MLFWIRDLSNRSTGNEKLNIDRSPKVESERAVKVLQGRTRNPENYSQTRILRQRKSGDLNISTISGSKETAPS